MHKNFEKISNNPFGYYDTNKDNITFASSIDNDIVHFYRKDIVIIIYECKIIEGKITDYNRKNIYINDNYNDYNYIIPINNINFIGKLNDN